MQNARNWAKADAKVQLFSIHSKFFGNFFSKNTKVFGIIDKIKGLYLINIYKAGLFYMFIYQKSLSLTQYTEQINKEVDEVEIER